MNFHQLRIFHTVATKGSFTQAANKLLLTQPAVSIQTQKLEEEYQIKVFDRIGSHRLSVGRDSEEGCKVLLDNC